MLNEKQVKKLQRIGKKLADMKPVKTREISGWRIHEDTAYYTNSYIVLKITGGLLTKENKLHHNLPAGVKTEGLERFFQGREIHIGEMDIKTTLSLLKAVKKDIPKRADFSNTYDYRVEKHLATLCHIEVEEGHVLAIKGKNESKYTFDYRGLLEVLETAKLLGNETLQVFAHEDYKNQTLRPMKFIGENVEAMVAPIRVN